jgi:sec-independent protein translocase protein TatB
MFNLGLGELILIGVIALIFIGPKQLPDVARSVAKFLNELKRASGEATSALMSVKDEANTYMNRVISDSETKLSASSDPHLEPASAVQADKLAPTPSIEAGTQQSHLTSTPEHAQSSSGTSASTTENTNKTSQPS